MKIALWLVVLIGLVVIFAAVFVYRRQRILMQRGAIEMSAHGGRGLRGGWALGVASYSDHYLKWYRLTSLRIGPSMLITRLGTEIISRREPDAKEAVWLPPDAIVLDLSTPEGPRLVAVPKTALPGLLSWWESAPPSWLRAS